MNIAILSGSPRANSNSLRFSKYLKNLIENKNHTAEIVDFHEFDIPSVGRGKIDIANLTTFQGHLTNVWQNAGLVIIVSPEYNWTVNGDLLNALHQLGGKDFAHLFDNKTFAMVGVSSGRGGKVPCLELTSVLNKIISFTNQYSVVSPRIFESHETPINLDADAKSTGNQIYENTVEAFLNYSIAVSNRWLAQK